MLNFLGGNSPERRVERLIAKGERLFQHGREQEGLEKFAEAATVLPEAASPSLHLGRAYFKLKDYDAALKHYYKALYFCKAAEEPAILGEIAQIYLALKRYDLVEEKLKKILQLDLPLPFAQIEKIQQAVVKGLAHLYLRTGRISEALDQHQLLLEAAPEDLQNLQMLAEAHRALGENQAARGLLQKAVEFAKHSGQHAELAQLERKLREVGFPDGAEFGIKERLYAEYGSICLGSAGDNGLAIALRPTLGPLAWQELVMTLRRLEAFRQTFAWTITCVVAADKPSGLLAAIAAQFLDAPLKPVTKVSAQDTALVCQLLFQEARPVQNLLKKLRRRTEASMTFALVALVHPQQNEYLPDIIGLPVDQIAKISRKNVSEVFSQISQEMAFLENPAATPTEKLIPPLLDQFDELPEEENLTSQVNYYLTQNMQLRVHLIPLLEPQPASAEATPEKVVNQLFSTRKGEMLTALKRLSAQNSQDSSVLTALQRLYVETSDAAIRRRIGKYLVQKRPSEGLPYLLDLFQKPTCDMPLKTALIETLSLTAQRQISNVLRMALQDPQEDLRLKATAHLAKLDYAQELTDLFTRLLHDTPPIIVSTVQFLTQCEPFPASAVLQQFLPDLLRHSDAAVVHAALDALPGHVDRRLIPLVTKLLKHVEPQISEHAIRTLGGIGDIEACYQVLPFLEHKSANFRYAAAASLSKLDPRRSSVLLLERLRKEPPAMQAKLLPLLDGRDSPETVSGIIQFAEEHFDQPLIVVGAGKVLGQCQDPRSLPFLRAALAQYPVEELLTPYIRLVNNLGETENVEILLTFLEYPPAIQFRVAGALYQHGLKRYFHILQDGLRSRKIPINLLASEVLGGIGDELSVQTLFAGFKKHEPRLDQKIAALIGRASSSSDYYAFFRNLPPVDAEMVMQGIQRAISGSGALAEVLNALDSLCVLRQADAIPVIQQFCATAASSVVLCGALRCLARYDPAGSRDVIKRRLQDENIEVANTAYVLMNQLKAYGFADE